MEVFAGLEMSLDETHVCVIDEGGRIIEETRASGGPKPLAKAVRRRGRRIEHVGLEAGDLSQGLCEARPRGRLRLGDGGAARPSRLRRHARQDRSP